MPSHRRAFLASLLAGGASIASLAGRLANAAPLDVAANLDWEPNDEKIAVANRDKLPVELRNTVAYFTTSTVEGEYRENLAATLCGIVPSLCHKTDLSYQIPKQISETVWRIDLLGLGWLSVWHKVMATYYPYYSITIDRHKSVPMIVRADWFCADLYNEVETGDAQYLLLYSGAIPKTRQEFLAFWKVQDESEFVYGMIEGQSGVAVNDKSGKESVRQIESRTTSRRGYCWITKDSARIAGVTDPVANLHLGPDGTEYDASEYIVGMYKVLRGEVAGCLQSYFLTDGNRKKFDHKGKKLARPQIGTRAAFAPVDIVEDNTNIRGREIVNSSGCIHCHLSGILPPRRNEYQRYIERGTRLNADYKTKYEIERYQGSDLEGEIKAHQKLYDNAIRACTGLSAPEFSAAFSTVVSEYVKALDLLQLARELAMYYPKGYLTANELQLAIGYASKAGILNARQAAIGEEDTITRDMVIQDYYAYQGVIQSWRKLKH